MWQVWPYVTHETTCDKCDHLWQLWPHVKSVTTCDKCDHIMDIWTSRTCGHHGHLGIMGIWTSWTFGHNKKHIWKSFLLNIWNILGRRYLRTFPSCFSRKYTSIEYINSIYCEDNSLSVTLTSITETTSHNFFIQKRLQSCLKHWIFVCLTLF